MRYGLKLYDNKELGGLELDLLPPKIGWLSSDKDTTKEGRELRTALEAIPGVEEATTYGYCVRLKRGGVFTWDEIVPKAVEVLAKFFGVPIEECEQVETYV